MDPVLAVILAAGLALMGVMAGHILQRVQKLEEDLAQERDYNRDLWHYCRRLLDLYYRHRRPDSPDPDPIPDPINK